MSETAIDALNKRIIEIMVKKNHSKSSFAKALDVSLPLITHITSGRNKPGIELIQKTLTVFEDISPDWLILGNGEMYRSTIELPDFSDIQAEITQLQQNLQHQISSLDTIRQYHKILIDELLHLQEADIEVNNIKYSTENAAGKLEKIRQNITAKLTL
jgi:transcriptional regulator with XRE-family HTH domain